MYGISCLWNYIAEIHIVEYIIVTYYLSLDNAVTAFARYGSRNLGHSDFCHVRCANNTAIACIEILSCVFAFFKRDAQIECYFVLIIACCCGGEYHTPELKLVDIQVGRYNVDSVSRIWLGVRHSDVVHDSIATQYICYEVVSLTLFGYNSVEIQEINKCSISTINMSDVVVIWVVHVYSLILAHYLIAIDKD